MRKQSIVVHATMICALVLALATVATAADPFVGTWKLNVAKSKFNPGPPPKSEIATFTAQDNGLKIFDDSVDADGKVGHLEFAPKFDGKNYPLKGDGVAPDTTATLSKINANTIEIVVRQGGKETSRNHEVVSKDGKTRTRTEKGKNDKGQDTNNTYVYEKQ